MTESVTIEKKKVKDDQYSFENLKREGIEFVQQLSGETWTDYNTHDPGVTILEQLCYTLTDLIYRADFNVEDYLTNESDDIDYEKQVLYAPEQIYTCRPTTQADYRRAILDAVSEIENVWLTTSVDRNSEIGATEGKGDTGLYRIAVRETQGLDASSKAEIIEKVHHAYSSNRNLCEDVEEINIVQDVDCQLCAHIEVSRGRSAANILAEIYHRCARRIAGSVRLYSYEEALNKGKSIEEILRGPLTSHGIFSDEELSDEELSKEALSEQQNANTMVEIPISCLFPIINEIDGVDHIKSLHIEKQGKLHYESVISESRLAPLRIYYPKNPEEIKVRLFADGNEIPIPFQEFRNRLQELYSRYHSLRYSAQDITSLYETPRGTFRNFAQYFSIQNQFPVVYGINAYGVPKSAPAQDKAKALQLKSYLLLFEQLIANAMAGLESLDTLFSVENTGQSYFYQVLDNGALPGVDLLYPEQAKETLGQVLNVHDNNIDRKNRLLDYLLALYGESFTQKSLRHFNYYYPQEKIDEMIISNKQTFLKSIVEIGRDRAGAFNYSKPGWNSSNVSGLQHRVSLLLGFKQYHDRSLTIELVKLGVKLAPHNTYKTLEKRYVELKFIETDEVNKKFDNVPIIEKEEPLSFGELREKVHDIAPLKYYVISEALFREGIYIVNYKLGSLTEEEDYQAVFKLKQEDQWWYLASYLDQQSGIETINHLRRFLIDLNIESEGMHILEHILLRPRGKSNHDSLSLPRGEDFYSCRISVIFPAWTARCHDQQFRLLAEETVQLNCPAHIYPEIYWLEFNAMYDFEVLYEKWLELKSDSHASTEELNEASQNLIAFLIEASHLETRHIREQTYLS